MISFRELEKANNKSLQATIDRQFEEIAEKDTAPIIINYSYQKTINLKPNS